MDNSRYVYRSEMGFSHAELIKGLSSAVIPYVVSRATEDSASMSVAMSFTLSFAGRVAYLHCAPESTRKIASIELPVTVVTIEFENFSEIQYTQFINRFKRYLHRGGG